MQVTQLYKNRLATSDQAPRRARRRGPATAGARLVVEAVERRVLMSGTPVPVNDTPEFRVNELTLGDQGTYGDRTLAADAQGNFVVAWESYGTAATAPGVYARRYNATGEPLSGEFPVLTGTGGDWPAVAMNASGSFAVVFTKTTTSGRQSVREVAGRRYDAAGTVLGDFIVPVAGGSPRVAMADDGSFVLAWSQPEAKATKGVYRSDVFAQRFSPAGAKVGTAFRVNDYTADDQSSPSVAMDGQGNFLVAWTSMYQDGAAGGVYAKRYAATGAVLQGEVRVNAAAPGNQSWASAAALPGGGYAVAWQETVEGSALNTTGEIRLRRFDGAAWSAERTVNTYTAGHQSAPSLAADGDGNVTVVWQSRNQDGVTGNAVYGQQYDAAGQPSGGEFRLNAYSNGAQAWSSVAAQPGGRFVAAWTSTGQDGSGQGVYARLFQPAAEPAPTTEPTFSTTAIGDESSSDDETIAEQVLA